ncbi:MAG: O-antigen ligase family protein [Bdellovibrio sp.]|nr:O-antigen ligase family protein [Bdellovibrio sp.]
MSLESFLLFFLGLYPGAAVTSQSILDATMFLISFGWIYSMIKKKTHKNTLHKIGIEWAFLGYLGAIAIGFIVNASPEAPWAVMFLKFSWILNLYILIFAFENVTVNIEKWFKFLCVLILLITIYPLATFKFDPDLINNAEASRLYGFVNSPTYHAHGNAMIFVFLFSILFFTFKKLAAPWKILSSVTIILLGASIYLTYTRGIWLSIFFSSIIMASLLLPKKKLLVLGLVSCVVIAGMYFGVGHFRDRVDHAIKPSANHERVNLFKLNVQMWQQYPLFGIGYGENMRRNREYWDHPEWKMPPGYLTSHAHNQYLNVLSTTGLFGFVFFISFCFYFLLTNFRLMRAAQKNKSSADFILLFSCLWLQIEFLIAELTDVSFEYAKIRAVYIFSWALVIAIRNRQKKSKLVKIP